MTEAELRNIEAARAAGYPNDDWQTVLSDVHSLTKALSESWTENKRFVGAMERITKRKGPFGDEDPRTDAGQLQHMRNIIENMASTAEDCLRPQPIQETSVVTTTGASSLPEALQKAIDNSDRSAADLRGSPAHLPPTMGD